MNVQLSRAWSQPSADKTSPPRRAYWSGSGALAMVAAQRRRGESMSEASLAAAEVILPSEPVSAPPELDPARARQFLVIICAMLFYQGYTMSVNGIGAPFIARSFHLGQSGISGLYAWVSISAFGALLLSRMADRIGRRRVLLLCTAGTPLCSLAVALAPSTTLFALFDIFLYSFITASISSSI